MNKQPVISLCLPTNGIVEWVFPVLDSIFSQNVDNSLFEVIVTDNGNNKDFKKLMIDYSKKYENLIYKETDAFMFVNQLEALKLANGLYLKFVNHRCPFTENSLKKLIDFIEQNKEEKPVIYFSNNALKQKKIICNSFDLFVKNLKRFASWTTGVGIWKENYDKLPDNLQYDLISPHSSILFSDRTNKKYIINNDLFCKEISTNHSKKGTYDLFKAFAIEELTITLKLYLDGDISANTLKYVKKDYKRMLSELYLDFIILKNKCSYDLSGFNNSMGIFFNKFEIKINAWLLLMPTLLKKIVKKIIRK